MQLRVVAGSRPPAPALVRVVGAASWVAGWWTLVWWTTELAGPLLASVRGPGPASTPEMLGAGAAVLVAALGGWLAAGTTLEVLAHAPGSLGAAARGLSTRVTPVLARRAVAVLLGAGLGSPTLPALALDATHQPAARAPAASLWVTGSTGPTHPTAMVGNRWPDPGFAPTPDTPAPPHPGWTPSAPRVRAVADPDLLTGAARHTAEDTAHVVVRRGDTLWAIAARGLGPGASAAEIAAAWPRWFAANAAVIGPDPDLLLPGQLLRPPSAGDSGEAR